MNKLSFHADELQLKAIHHGEGAMLVTAGPGSGKTTVITHRIHYLIHHLGVSPEQILVITFTKSAAVEMQKRFISLCNNQMLPVFFGTFHAFFYGILKEQSEFRTISLIQEKEKNSLLKEVIYLHAGFYPEEEMLQEFLRQFSYIRNHDIKPEEYEPLYYEKELFLKVYREFYGKLCHVKKIDFDDMMLMCRKLFKDNPAFLDKIRARYSYILIDEFQDINAVQYELMHAIAGAEGNIFAVGDEDQAIYGFRGSDPMLMFRFLEDYREPQHVFLTKNYRCDGEIVKLADCFIRRNTKRFQKDFFAVQTRDKKSVFLGNYKNSKKCYEDMACKIKELLLNCKPEQIGVLFRTNASDPALIKCLEENCIPVKGINRKKKEDIPSVIKDIHAYLYLGEKVPEKNALLRILNKPCRYLPTDLLRENDVSWDSLEVLLQNDPISLNQLLRLKEHITTLHGMCPYAGVLYIRKAIGYEKYLMEEGNQKDLEILSLLQHKIKEYDCFQHFESALEEGGAVFTGEKKWHENGIVMSTIHQAKGLEYEYVFIPDILEGMYPFHKAKTKEALEEERRIFYVAMTRAKKGLFLYTVEEKAEEKKPGIFYEEIKKDRNHIG
ncbi:MAG: ATP-dependent helicase [Lachnospiraceae bacterium]|nr:ATP-dependent helicase [Lachnospiraceae bacterium]